MDQTVEPGALPPLADDRLESMEAANLPSDDTGVDEIIHISSMQASHGPRVKWYPGRPTREGPCLTVTLEDPRRTIGHGLSAREAATGERQVGRWVALNRDALLDFWFNGFAWTVDELHAFTKGLKKLP